MSKDFKISGHGHRVRTAIGVASPVESPYGVPFRAIQRGKVEVINFPTGWKF